MRLCVTGGCGYVGARLVPKLLGAGHVVDVYDPQWFGAGDPAHNDSLTVEKFGVPNWTRYGAVIYLSGLTNNNSCVAADKVARGMAAWNANVYQPLYELKSIYLHEVPHVIFLSSAAVLQPSTPYAKAKLVVEAGIRYLNSDWTIIRSASVCGPSTNMRFDTPVNRMVLDAHQKGEITVNGGDQYRTHVHIDDLCEYIISDLNGRRGGIVTLVGENQTLMQTAKEVAEVTGAKIVRKPADNNRSYRAESSFPMGSSIKLAINQVAALLKSANPGVYANAETDAKFNRLHTL